MAKSDCSQHEKEEKQKSEFESIYHCEHCDFKTNKNTCFAYHKKLHQGIKYHCPQCPFQTVLKTNLSRHVKTVHDKVTDLECKQCDYKTALTANFVRHIRAVHQRIKDFECRHCDHKTTNKKDLKSHVKAVHQKTHPREKDKAAKEAIKPQIERIKGRYERKSV